MNFEEIQARLREIETGLAELGRQEQALISARVEFLRERAELARTAANAIGRLSASFVQEFKTQISTVRGEEPF